MDNRRLAILLSGRGSNFVAIYEAIQRGDLEAEICSIVENMVNQAVGETCRQITQNQREQLICHIEDARLHLDEFARQGHYTPKTQELWLAVSDLADAMKQIVTRLV